MMMTKGSSSSASLPHSNTSAGWTHGRPHATMNGGMRQAIANGHQGTTTIATSLSSSKPPSSAEGTTATAMSISTAATTPPTEGAFHPTNQNINNSNLTGLKIRIPRDLPNLPDAFRRRGAIRSQPPTSTSTSSQPPSSASTSASSLSIVSPVSSSLSSSSSTMTMTLPYAIPGTVKRTYSTMLLEDHQLDLGNHPLRDSAQDNDKRHKVTSKIPDALMPLPSHLSKAKNLAIRTTRLSPNHQAANNNSSLPALSAPSANSSPRVLTSLQQQQRRHHRSGSSASKSSTTSSSIGTPVRIASPGASADAASTTNVVVPSPPHPTTDQKAAPLITASHSHGTRSSEGTMMMDTDEVMATTTTMAAAPSSTSTSSAVAIGAPTEQDLLNLKPIEIVRIGMSILDVLMCNTFCKGFLNPVPTSVANYYVVIKKPMDLTTIEKKLWKTYELINTNSTGGSSKKAPVSTTGDEESYSSLEDLEKDLRRIFQNATYFNSPSHPIYKEAHSYQSMYLGLLTSYRQGQMQLNTPIPHESFRPEMISLSEPGPLYLFRAHTLREMERKMTDISTDLFSTLHQPLFDVSTEIGEITPERPRFVRMYINKNRSVLAKCRDEQFARVAILSDMQIGKPYMASIGSPNLAKSSPDGQISGKDSSGGSVSMVRVSGRVLIGKPIGERHDMVTVGDLDCPNAWITVACVQAMEIDVEVPAKFEKGTLSKMRHELLPLVLDSKMTPEQQRVFADELGLLLPNSSKAGQIVVPGGYIGQRSAIPIGVTTTASTTTTTPSVMAPPPPVSKPSSPKGLGITTIVIPSRPPSPTSSSTTSTPRSSRPGPNDTKATPKSLPPQSPAAAQLPMATVHDQGPKGRLLLTVRLPSLVSPKSSASTPTATTPSSTRSSRRISSSSTQQHVYAASTPATPLIPPSTPGTTFTLSSQIPATQSYSEGSGVDALSAADHLLLQERITKRGSKMLTDLKVVARQMSVPYSQWDEIEPTLTVDSAHGLFKRIYHVKGQPNLVVQNFKEMDAESFEQRVREVACLLKLRGLKGVGQIQSVIDNEEKQLVGLSMTKYAYTLKQYATNARRHPTPAQKLCLIQDMVSAMCEIHEAGLAHRDLSEVNIMVDEDPKDRLEDNSARPHVKVIDFGKSVFVRRQEVERWSMQEKVLEEELALLPMVVLPPDHGYKLYRSILTLPKNKYDHVPLPPVDPRSEDVYSLGVLIWRTFSGKSPWNGAIEDDLKTIRYLVSTDAQIRFQLEKEVIGPYSRELLLHCLTAKTETRSTSQQLKVWLSQPKICSELLKEFEALGGGRKKVRKNLD